MSWVGASAAAESSLPGSTSLPTGLGASTSQLSQCTELEVKAQARVVAQLIEGAPEVAVCTAVMGGALHDPATTPGVYRVLSEMLNDGGYRSSSDDYRGLVAERGGRNEVTVLPDSTVYCTTVPSSEIELALWVASSRFSASALTEENLKEAVSRLSLESEQRDAAVHEGRAPVRLRKMAFLGTPALGHSPLSSPEELEAIDIESIQAAHKTSYVAQRSVISIVGGGSRKSAETGIEKYLQRMHVGQAPEEVSFSLVPQHTMRFSMDEDRSAKTPAAWYGWVIPEASQRAAAHAAFQILMGEEGRLTKKVLSGARPAKRATLHFPFERTNLPSLAQLEVIGRYNHALAVVEKDLDEQLRKLAQEGPTEAELQKYQQALVQEQRAQLTTAQDRAFHLSRGVLAGFSSDEILAPLNEEYSPKIPSPREIQAVIESRLKESQRSIIEVYPKGWQDPWQAPMPLFHIVEKGQTLGSIARHYGTAVDVITKMNGINKNKPIYPGDKLKVPRGKVKKERPARTHQVRRGDTLSGIAVKYGVKVRDIASANGMGSRQTIRIGETLTVPWPRAQDKDSSSGSSPSSSAADSNKETHSSSSTHVVSSGETLSGIAHKHGVSTVALAQANGISHKAMVKIGQSLKLPPPGSGKAESVPAFINYTVKAGDNLSTIAKKHGVSVAEITVANRMSRKSTIRPGQQLKIPKHDP